MPKDSLKFFYSPDDDSDSKGGFTTVSVGTDTMNVTFYNYKGTMAFLVNGVCTRIAQIESVTGQNLIPLCGCLAHT